jgi:3-oxoacyl-[acyl-carrier-protein] synthase II
MARRAVFTGLGVISPIGSDPASFFASLRDGRSGVAPIRTFDASGLTCRIAAQMPDFDAKKFLPPSAKDARKSLKVMSRPVQLGVCASQKAMDDAKLVKGSIAPSRFGIEYACVMVASEMDDLTLAGQATTDPATREVDYAAFGGDKGIGNITPLWMLKYLPNMPACHTSIFFGAEGPNNTITASEAAGLLAMGEAYRLMQRDKADFFLVGGTESKTNPVSFPRHDLFSKFCLRNDDPAGAVRPFDLHRDGWVLAEGAATFALEERSHAEARGARIDGELIGYAAGFDRGMTGAVFAKVILKALAEANLTPADIDHVNAAAFGSVEWDAFEARAIHAVFGTSTPVFAPKAFLGSSGAASSLVEMAASVLAMREGVLPGTINHTTPDPACPVTVATGPRPIAKSAFVKLAYTDMGHCAAIVVASPR